MSEHHDPETPNVTSSTRNESVSRSMGNLSLWAVKHPAFIGFLMIACSVAGLQAYLQLGRAEDPSFTIKTGVVSAVWPGATSEEMQEQVAEEVETKLRETPYLDFLQTYCIADRLQVLIQLKDSTPPSEVSNIWYQVRKKLGDIQPRMPSGVIGPFVNDEYGDVYSAIYGFYGKDFDYAELKRIAESARKRLLRVADVEKVDLVGDQDERIFIEFSHQRLATLGVTPQQIFESVQKQNVLIRSGSIDTKFERIPIRVSKDFGGIEQIENVPIQANQKVFRLKDVATVKRGYEDPALFLVYYNGQPTVAVGVVMRKGGNVLSLGESLDLAMSEVKAGLPLGVEVGNIAFQPKIVNESVGEFLQAFAEALLIVLVVSFLSLGLRTGIVVALSVPLVLAITLVIMHSLKMNLDRISLGALILALGLLVDDAIIAVEMMAVKMEEGWDRVSAAGYAWTSTAFPMLSGTMITVAGFVPVGFANSSSGEYAGGIFWVVAIALTVSWIVAVMFTPYLGVLLLPSHSGAKGNTNQSKQDASQSACHNDHVGPFQTRFHKILRWVVTACVRRPVYVLSFTFALFLASLFGFTKLQQQFFPLSSRTELMVDVRMHEGASISATRDMIQSVEQVIAPYLEPSESETTPMVEHYVGYVGAGSARFFLALNPDLPNPSFGKLVIQTRDINARELLRTKLKTIFESDPKYSDASMRVLRLDFGPPVGYPVQFRVVGPEPARVHEIATQVREVMRTHEAALDVNLEWDERSKMVELDVDQDRARLLGLTPQDIELSLQTLLSGTTISEFRDGTETIPVVARAIENERLNLETLGDFTVFTNTGAAVPLSQVGKLKVATEEPIVWRRNQDRVLSVRCDISDGFQAPDVSGSIDAKLSEVRSKLPPGYRIELGGAVEESTKANIALFQVFPVMILIMLILLMSQVHSFKKMFLIFGIAPLGLIGAVAALHLFNAPFGFVALLGVIALAGMDMRNSVILVDQISQDMESGLSEWEAVIESSVRRARPVVLTAATAILAMIPLTRSVFWGPMAMAIMGGLSMATFLTLINLPALYVLLFKVREPAKKSIVQDLQEETQSLSMERELEPLGV